jgi:hypothetical protein
MEAKIFKMKDSFQEVVDTCIQLYCKSEAKGPWNSMLGPVSTQTSLLAIRRM